jgi:3-oxoadipate enol-lactonase
MNHLGLKKAHILGISMGGMIAQEIAINHPERVMKLILGSTYACDDGNLSGLTPEWAPAVDQYQQGQVGPLMSLMLNRRSCRLVFLPLAKTKRLFWKPSSVNGFKAHRSACLTHQALERLPLIKSPTLVIVGTEDRLIKPTSSEVLAARIPGAKLVKVKRGSHSFCLEMSNIFNNEILKFLKERNIYFSQVL